MIVLLRRLSPAIAEAKYVAKEFAAMTVTWPPVASSPTAAPAIDAHPGYLRLFSPNRLTLGLIMPLETYPDTPAPTMRGHLEMAQRADEAGFSALWMRDVPFYDPSYGDAGQVFEPLVYIAALAAATRSIALGLPASSCRCASPSCSPSR